MFLKKLYDDTQFIRTAVNQFLHRKFLSYRESLVWYPTYDDISDADVNLYKDKRIAVHIHVFYTDVFEKILSYINAIPYRYDLFISTTDNDKKKAIDDILRINKCNAESVVIDIFENRGRDVMPFILQMKTKLNTYEYILHVHTKKSAYRDDGFGDRWGNHLLRNLIGNKAVIKSIFCRFSEDKNIGLIYPYTFPPLWYAFKWDGNKMMADELAERMGFKLNIEKNIFFPAGNMFYARTAAIKSIFDDVISLEEFPQEPVPIDGTIIHAIERMWVYVCEKNDYGFLQINCDNLYNQ